MASKASLSQTALHRSTAVIPAAPAQEATAAPCTAAGARRHLEAHGETRGTPPRAALTAREARHPRGTGGQRQREAAVFTQAGGPRGLTVSEDISTEASPEGNIALGKFTSVPPKHAPRARGWNGQGAFVNQLRPARQDCTTPRRAAPRGRAQSLRLPTCRPAHLRTTCRVKNPAGQSSCPSRWEAHRRSPVIEGGVSPRPEPDIHSHSVS